MKPYESIYIKNSNINLRKEARDNIVTIGIGISTAHESIIEDMFDDRGITDYSWDDLSDDIRQLEINISKWLNKNFVSFRDEGHSNEALVGTLTIDTSNRKQVRLIQDMFSYGEGSGDFQTINSGSGDLDSLIGSRELENRLKYGVINYLPDLEMFDFGELEATGLIEDYL